MFVSNLIFVPYDDISDAESSRKTEPKTVKAKHNEDAGSSKKTEPKTVKAKHIEEGEF